MDADPAFARSIEGVEDRKQIGWNVGCLPKIEHLCQFDWQQDYISFSRQAPKTNASIYF